MDHTTHIAFVRHGHVDNPDHLFYGRLEGFPLSPLGFKQAAAVREYLKATEFLSAYCSPRLRACQTAEIILAAHPELSLLREELIDEVHTPYDGKPIDDLKSVGWDTYAGTAPQFEQPTDVLDRSLRFIRRVLLEYPGQRTLAVTHGDVIAFLVLWATGRPVTASERLVLYKEGIAPCSISTLSFANGKMDEKPGYAYIEPIH